MATLVVGLAGVQYGMLRADELGRADLRVLLLTALGVAVLACFVAVERRTVDGLVDVRLFRNRTFTGAAVAIALASAAYFGLLVYLSLFLQSTQHYTALEAGLVYLPTILPYMLISPLAGRLLDRFPGAHVPAAGCLLAATGMLLLTRIGGDASVLDVAPAMVVTGAGSGLIVAPLMKLALDRVPDARTGMAGGVMQTMRPLGVTLGVTVLGTAVHGRLGVTAFHTVAALAAGLAAMAAIVAIVFIRQEEGAPAW